LFHPIDTIIRYPTKKHPLYLQGWLMLTNPSSSENWVNGHKSFPTLYPTGRNLNKMGFHGEAKQKIN
jgi:hypothetical protein